MDGGGRAMSGTIAGSKPPRATQERLPSMVSRWQQRRSGLKDAFSTRRRLDAYGNAIQEHIYLGDQPVAVIQGQSGSVGYVTTDQLNTPRVITDSSPQANIEWS